jgi:hypothetical protein
MSASLLIHPALKYSDQSKVIAQIIKRRFMSVCFGSILLKKPPSNIKKGALPA